MIDSSVVLEKLKLLLPLAQQMEPAAQLLCEQAAQAVSGKLAQPEFGRIHGQPLRPPRLPAAG